MLYRTPFRNRSNINAFTTGQGNHGIWEVRLKALQNQDTRKGVIDGLKRQAVPLIGVKMIDNAKTTFRQLPEEGITPN